MERELILTGIGGQGVQLAARTLAVAAMKEGREVVVFGMYEGVMRGGSTDATVVIGDGPVETPPTVDETWSALAMHHQYWPDVRERLRKGGVVVIDSSVFLGDPGIPGCEVVAVDASARAQHLGHARGGSMIALGAYAAVTGVVSLDSLVAAAREVLPPYRSQHAEANIAALRAGHAGYSTQVPAWPSRQQARI